MTDEQFKRLDGRLEQIVDLLELLITTQPTSNRADMAGRVQAKLASIQNYVGPIK